MKKKTDQEVREICLQHAGTEKYCAVAQRIEYIFGDAIRKGKTVKSITKSDYRWNERINRSAAESNAVIVGCSGKHGSGFNSYYLYVWVEE